MVTFYRTLTKDPRNIPSLANNKNNIRGEVGKRRNFSSTQENIHMKKNNKGGREGSATLNSPPGAAMGEAEATAAKSTKASDAAREPAAEEEGTAPMASGVCGEDVLRVLIHFTLHSSLSEFPWDSENL